MPDNKKEFDFSDILDTPAAKPSEFDFSDIVDIPEVKKKSSSLTSNIISSNSLIGAQEQLNPLEATSKALAPTSSPSTSGNFTSPSELNSPVQGVSRFDIIKDKAKNDFINNPIFQEKANRDLYYSRLEKLGYDNKEIKKFGESVIQHAPELKKVTDNLKKNPSDAQSFYELARIQGDMGDKEQSTVNYFNAIQLSPKSDKAYYGLGYNFLNDGDNKGAIDYFNKTLELNPKNYRALNARAIGKYNLKDYDGALKDVNEAIKLNPESQYNYLNRATILNKLGQKDKAQEDAKTAEEIHFMDSLGEIKSIGAPGTHEYEVAQRANIMSDFAKEFERGEGLFAVLNPLGRISTSSVEGVKAGIDQIKRTEDVYNKEGQNSAAANLAAGIAKIGFGVGTIAVPQLAAFTAGVGIAETVVPEKYISYAMAPVSSILRDLGKAPQTEGGKSAAELFDILGSLVILKTGERGIKGGYEIGRKILNKESLTGGEVNNVVDIMNNTSVSDFEKTAQVLSSKNGLVVPASAESVANVKPTSSGKFGEIYGQFKGKTKEAISFLLGKKGGEVVGAANHPTLGDIDFIWGEEGTGKSDGMGLAKIAKYHPEILSELGDIIPAMEVVSKSKNRAVLESEDHKVIISLDFNGESKTWLLNAYEKGETSSPGSTIDIAKNKPEVSLQDDTTTLQKDGSPISGEPVISDQSDVIDNKATNTIPENQINIDNNAKEIEAETKINEEAKVEGVLEGKPQEETGIKNAVVKEERAAEGKDPVEVLAKRDFKEVFDRGKKMVDDGEIDARQLARTLSEKPRALNAEESAALVYDRMRLRNEHKIVMDQLSDAIEKGDDVKKIEAQVRLSRIEDDVNFNDEAARRTGYEQGLGLAARRLMIQEDYSMSNLVQRVKAATGGGEVSKEIRIKLETLSKKLEDANRLLEEHEAKISELQSKREFQKAQGDVAKEVRSTRRKATSEAIKKERVDLLSQLSEIAKKSRGQASVNPIPAEMVPVLGKLMKNYIKDGINTIEAVVDNIYEDLKDHVDGLNKRDIRDSLSGYGKLKQLSKKEIDVQLRDLKGQMRLTSALEDAMVGERPLKSGLERDKPSDKVRELQRKVKEEMKKNGIEIEAKGTAEDQWKSALDAIKTRFRNSISDLTKQLETGEKTPKKAGVEYDQEALDLKKQRDELKAALEEIEGKPEMTDEQRVKLATSAVEKSITEYQRRIDEFDFNPAKKVSKTPETPELKSLRETRDALKESFEQLKDAATPKKTPEEIALQRYKTSVQNRIGKLQAKLDAGDFEKTPKKTTLLDQEAMKLRAEAERVKHKIDSEVEKIKLQNRSKFEKTLDFTAKWRRAILLSSAVTLGKLASAATMRGIVSPIEQIVGAGLSKIPGLSKVAAKAPREGRFSPSAEVKALSAFFEKATYKDAYSVAKSGKGELDLLYGKKKIDLPSDAMDFFGQLHGALKAPAKRSEFFRSFEMRAEHYKKQGKDISDPTIQATIAGEAYVDATRAIFMQENIVSKAYNLSLNYIEGRGDKGKIAATIGRVLLPIIKVPTNFVAESSSYIAGAPKAALALRKGIEKLTPEQSDYVMRALKKQSLGAAALAIGYFAVDNFGGYYQKGVTKKGDGELKAGDFIFFDTHLPHFMLHNPVIEAIQFGATIRRVQDHYTSEGKEGGVSAGIGSGLVGMAKEVPFIETQGRLYEALQTPEGRGKWVAELAKSLAIPPDIDRIARYMDQVDGEEVKRKPQGFLEVIKLGIPGLRETVISATEELMEKRLEKNKELSEEERDAQILKSEEGEVKKEEKEEELKKLCRELGIEYVDSAGQKEQE